ncbi:hypothetical protein V8F33_012318 [Rhypophila sp. PSN 637]
MHAATLIRLFMGMTAVVIGVPVDDPLTATKTTVATVIVSSPLLSDFGNLPISTSKISETSTTRKTTKTRTTTKKAGLDYGCYPAYCYGAPCSFADCRYYCKVCHGKPAPAVDLAERQVPTMATVTTIPIPTDTDINNQSGHSH